MHSNQDRAFGFALLDGRNCDVLLEPSKFCVTFDMLQRFKGVALLDASKLEELTEEDAKKIYMQQLWQPLSCDYIPSGLDYFVFVCGLYSYSDTVIRWLQYSVGLAQTGLLDSETLSAVQKQSPHDLIVTLERLLRRRLRTHWKWNELNQVWTNYVNSAKHRALVLLETANAD